MSRLPASLIVLLLVSRAQSAIIFNNGLPNQVSGNDMTEFVQTEDFVLAASTTVTDAHFWSVENPAAANPWDGTLEWFIFNDAGGEPAAAPLASGSGVSISKVATGNVLFFGMEYVYDFLLDTPVPLAGGTTYWFGLHLASNFDRNEIYWETTSSGLGSTGEESFEGTFDNWFNNSQHHAFYLTDDARVGAVPEFSSLVTWGLLLSAAGAAIFKRRGWKKTS